jgi:hypothetical protein
MAWLTDSGRREREWRRRAGQRADIGDPCADRLPDGGLRCRYEWADGHRVWRFTTEDVVITANTIERVYRGQLARPRAMPVRWVIPRAGSRRAGVLAPARSFLLPQIVYARICTRRVACFVFGRRIARIPSFMVAWTFSVSMSRGSTVR